MRKYRMGTPKQGRARFAPWVTPIFEAAEDGTEAVRFHALGKTEDASIEEAERGLAGLRALDNMSRERPAKIKSAADVYALLSPKYATAEVEFFLAVHLNTKNDVIRVVEVGKGGIDGCLAAPRDVYREAVRDAVSAIIVAHNHPSGDPEPSRDDLSLTRRLVEAGEVVGIRLLDHVVLGATSWVSLKDRGVM